MIEIAGKSFFPCPEAVTGRLFVAGRAERQYDMAKILLWDGCSELCETDLQNAVGAVILPSSCKKRLSQTARLAEFLRLPSLLLDTETSCLPSILHGNIAILDSQKERLYVDPDLETINVFFGVSARKYRHDICILEECQKIKSCLHDGIVIGKQLPSDADEDKAYDFFCNAADENTGKIIVATVNFSKDHPERLLSGIRAVYRAGVWGRFSLLCASVPSPESADRCISLMHTAFCQLDDEGREFNGFMPKGIEISTPLMLLCPPKHRMIDFFCVDYARLRELFTDSKDIYVGDTFTAERITAFSRNANNVPLSLRTGGEITQKALRSIILSDSVRQIYAKPNEISALTSWL